MISSIHRFHGRNSLRFIYHNAKVVRGPLVSLRYALNSRQRLYRVAVVVSRKVSKSAVVRNRVRRRLYEIVRKHSNQINKPYDLVFTVYDERVADTGHAGLQKIVVGQLKQAGALQIATSGEDDVLLDKEETNK
jgi:ribonuclease P protein component